MDCRQLYLTKLIEECAEVQQRAAKQQQFGRNEIEPGQNLRNLSRLKLEMWDLLTTIRLVEDSQGLPRSFLVGPELGKHMMVKRFKILKYLDYSVELGMVTLDRR